MIKVSAFGIAVFDNNQRSKKASIIIKEINKSNFDKSKTSIKIDKEKILVSINKFLGKKNDLTKNRVAFEVGYDLDEIKKHIEDDTYLSKLDDIIKYIDNVDPIDVFRELNSPIFVLNFGNWGYQRFSIPKISKEFIVNPILKEYEFYKVFDSFMAFQEISMFLGGVLGSGEKDIIEIDDKYKT